MAEEAAAFVPGHVTGLFSAHRVDDPRSTGSRGAGATLTHGVEVTVCAGERSVQLNGERATVAPVDGVLDAFGVDASVSARTDLPVGAGFGVSGALALGTALATNAAFDGRRSENDLVAIAHVAEVEAGTGLGDVVAQARGGIPLRLEPGAPGRCSLDAIPARTRVEYCTFGELTTEEIITGDTDRLSAAGEDALSRLVREPTLPRFMAESRRFAREAGLLTERVEAAIEDVLDAGGEAAMAMLGESVFALGTGLSDAGYDPEICHTHTAGAALSNPD